MNVIGDLVVRITCVEMQLWANEPNPRRMKIDVLTIAVHQQVYDQICHGIITHVMMVAHREDWT